MRASTLHKHPGAHPEGIWCCAWLPSGSLLTGSVDESVKLWDLSGDAPACAHDFTGQTLGAVSLAADASGAHVACSALDSIVRVWNPLTGETVAVVERAPTETWAVAMGPASAEGVRVAVAGGSCEQVCVYSCRSGEHSLESSMQLPAAEGAGATKRERFVLGVAYSPDHSKLAASAMDGTVALYDAATGQLLQSLRGHSRPVRSLAFTPDGKMLLTGSDDAHANLFDVASGGLVDSFSGHESWVLSVAVHPGGTAFATASSDARVRLWDLSTRACVQTLGEHSDQVWGLAFNADGTRLASAGDDKMLTVYSIA
ncbi:hypothetical protein Rsub_03499 [Raphidocelis subcapitata]|uniref:Uncharacterized protein n=1 Tax=Raphidocelis subcapitata TaxID=307507 RepID=A0A2V0NY61_9CHLO|nr:hypothetical protein Rsub_03499 [Raphidocelis subcapitata]|eukprot:GBF90503.1 hypothetical protein Rsub_03499 [Raphidocelis subcapitata]